MEQWMKDGRFMLFERWKTMSGVVGDKSNPTSVRGVDESVLQLVLSTCAKNRHRACVSSQLLHSDFCKTSVRSSDNKEHDSNSNSNDSSELHFKFADGHFSRGVDRSGYFGLVQREKTSNATSGSSSSEQQQQRPQPHARVLVDYAWVFRDRIYDFTTDFSFIAGAGVVPQALEEAVLYCSGGKSVEALYEAAGNVDNSDNDIADGEEDNKKKQLQSGYCFDGFEEILCDSDFAFREEGTRLLATDYAVRRECDAACEGDNNKSNSQRRVAVPATTPAMVIPADATVSLLVRVTRFCNPKPTAELIEIAEKLKAAGNSILTGGDEQQELNTQQRQQQQQQQHVDCASESRTAAAAANQTTKKKACDSNATIPECKHRRARRWYERAMQQLTPETMRTASTVDARAGAASATAAATSEEIYKKLLTSLGHNISMCYFEEAAALLKQNNNNNNNDPYRALLKKSISFASEAVKLSQGKHSKSLYRRAAANAQLGNLEEAEGDLRNIANLNPGAAEDSSVAALRASIREQVKKADDAMRRGMQKGLSSENSSAATAATAPSPSSSSPSLPTLPRISLSGDQNNRTKKSENNNNDNDDD